MKITYYEAVNNNLQVKYNPEKNLLMLYLNGQKNYYVWDPETGVIYHIKPEDSYAVQKLNRLLTEESECHDSEGGIDNG